MNTMSMEWDSKQANKQTNKKEVQEASKQRDNTHPREATRIVAAWSHERETSTVNPEYKMLKRTSTTWESNYNIENSNQK